MDSPDREELLKKLSADLASRQIEFEEWKIVAEPAEKEMRSIAENLQLNRRNVNISQIVGSSVSTGVGVPLMIAGLALMPFTGGLSLGLTIAGSGVSIAGGLTAGGAAATEAILRNNSHKSFKETFESLMRMTEELQKRRDQLFGLILESLTDIRFKNNVPDHIKTEKLATIKISSNIFFLFSRVGSSIFNIGDDLFRIGATQSLFGIGRAAPVLAVPARIAVGTAAAALTAALDIYTIVTSAQNLAGGSKDEAIKKLTEAADNIAEIREANAKFLEQAEGVKNGDFVSLAELLRDKWPCQICNGLGKPIQCPHCRKFICSDCARSWTEKRSHDHQEGEDCPYCRGEWSQETLASTTLEVNDIVDILIEEYVD